MSGACGEEMTPLKNILQDARWTLPPAAEQIRQIAAAVGVTAEVMQVDSRFAAWDALQAEADADLGESPYQTRQEVGV
jgi:hypothetical protein